MTWTPRGRIFPVSRDAVPPWIGTYATLPFAVPLDDDRARVFFTGRDAEGRSSIGACSIDLRRLTVDSATVTPEPLVAPGPIGAFDDSGCSMSCVVQRAGRLYLYYTGWMLGRTVPFYLAIGLSVSDDGGRTFQKPSAAPVLDRSSADPFLTASPSVMIEDGVWRMWYVSALEWQMRSGGDPRHVYLIKYAESSDGIVWRRDGRIAIDFEDPSEYAMGRPYVMRDGDRYRMWFCVRGERYRIACAESPDGIRWNRCDRSELAPPRQEWDAEMQAYPMVLPHAGRWIMFYNGNRYGATGFGCATTEHLP